MDNVADAEPQWRTPAASETRGLWLARHLLVVVFVCTILCGPLAWCFCDGIETKASVPATAVDWDRFTSGKLAKGFAGYVKELSPVTYYLRGIYNEARFELGMLSVPEVVFGRDDWFFFRHSVEVPAVDWATVGKARRHELRQIQKLALSLGMKLLAVPAPDKSTIYPDHLLPGQLSAAHDVIYEQILAAFRDCGVAVVDAKSVLLQHRLECPQELLYYERDSHWTCAGCRVLSAEIQEEVVRQGWAPDIGAPMKFFDLRPGGVLFVGDLVTMLGMRTADSFGQPGASFTVRRLQERRDFLLLEQAADGARHLYIDEGIGAQVALCGTCFSHELRNHLVVEFGVAVNMRGVLAGGGIFGGMKKLFAAVASGELKPKVLVWEFVERDFLLNWSLPDELLQINNPVQK
ncbi:alginate O-acetyltransferase [Planctomycetota bacterium]|nr:alginate O-acetyltransferase [Planctomycetota bacterium]